MSGVVSKKLKFKGDKPKKKKRSHRDTEGGDDGGIDLAALVAADPKGWVFPTDVDEVSGPSFILLPSEPLSCLAWDPQRQRVYAAPVDVPEAPEGAAELSSSEILQAIEPSDVNHVWVISRLSGSEEVISLRTSAGTFLTAHPSGTLSATTPSRGPLESFTPLLSPASSSSSSSIFPEFALKTQSEHYLSSPANLEAAAGGKRAELRADAEGREEQELLRIKCQRENVYKARLQKNGGEQRDFKRSRDGAGGSASIDDEMARNREAQTWGAGRSVVSNADRKDLKKAAKEGRYAEAMLDRRAAMKSDRYAK